MNKNLKNGYGFRLFSVIFGLIPKILAQRCSYLVNKDDHKSVLQCGRSMIEMLGVLAIIAVLSVGGIAGYSKAMTKFKVNKAVNDYSSMIFGLLEHIDEIKKQPINSGYVDLAYSLNLVPNSWKEQSSHFLIDDFNNNVQLYNMKGPSGVGLIFVFEIYFGQYSKGYFENPEHQMFCREMMTTLAKPLHEVVYAAYLRRGKTSSANDFLFGTKYCSGSRKCLANVTLNQINKLCKSCTVDNSGDCSLVLYF